MNKQDEAAGAFVLQTTISVILLSFLVVLLASSSRASSTKPGEQPESVDQSGFYPPLPKSIVSMRHLFQNSPEQGVVVTAPTVYMNTSDGFAINDQAVTVSSINPALNYIGFQADLIFDSAVAAPTPGTAPVAAAGLTNTGSPGWTVSGNVISTCNGSPCPGTLRTLRVAAFSNDGVTPLSGGGILYQIHWKRVSALPQSTALTWGSAATGYDFEFIDTDLNLTSASPQNNGLITIVAPTPCSCVQIDISGTITYCSNPINPPIPNVTVFLSGQFGASSTQTNATGFYHLQYSTAGGFDPHFTVVPGQANLSPGSAGITTVDVIATQRHFLGVAILSGCRLTAADVNGDSGVTTVDVIAIQRFYLGLSTGTANVGQHRFVPTSRGYVGNVTLTNENYSALVLGDVASSFVY